MGNHPKAWPHEAAFHTTLRNDSRRVFAAGVYITFLPKGQKYAPTLLGVSLLCGFCALNPTVYKVLNLLCKVEVTLLGGLIASVLWIHI